MLENGVFNRPYVRDITKICECACSMNCDKNATELRPARNPDLITNADRIRAMSDEELLDFMKKSVANAYMCKIMRTEPMFLTLNWLQQPAKEDT